MTCWYFIEHASGYIIMVYIEDEIMFVMKDPVVRIEGCSNSFEAVFLTGVVIDEDGGTLSTLAVFGQPRCSCIALNRLTKISLNSFVGSCYYEHKTS